MDRLAAGDLRGGARTRAERHVRTCAPCRSRLEASTPARSPEGVTRWTGSAAQPSRVREAEAREADANEVAGHVLIDEIHRGGQGIVYRARRAGTGEPVAVKILRESAEAPRDQLLRFEREVSLAKTVDHAGIVPVIESGTWRGRPYLVMPLVEGLTLDAWLRERRPTLREILLLFRRLCSAVAHAHERGVIHRDLKPSNILVDDADLPHVVDFGVAKGSMVDDALTVTGEFVGTIAHASPEQAKGDPRLVDARTDVYALGFLLYQALTGRAPYPISGPPPEVLRHVLETEPRHPRAVNPALDDEISRVLLKALAKDVNRRYQSVGALDRDLEAYLAGLPVEARGEPTMDLLRRAARRYRTVVAAVAVALVAFAVIAAFASWQALRLAHARDRAEQAEALARQQASAALEAGERARADAYAANVAAASLYIQVGQLAAARARLDACAEDLRGFEWRHLAFASRPEVAAVRGDGSAILALGRGLAGGVVVVRADHVEDRSATTLELTGEHPAPQVALAVEDQSARLEIVSATLDGARVLLRWNEAAWSRLGRAGRSLYVARPDGTIEAVLEGAAWRADVAAISPDGRSVVAHAPQGAADPLAWDVETHRVRTLHDPGRGASRATSPVPAFSADGRFLAEACGDGRVRAWDVAGHELLMRDEDGGLAASALAFMPDGDSVLVGLDGEPSRLRVLGLDANLLAEASLSSRVTAVATGSDALVAGDARGAVHVFALPGAGHAMAPVLELPGAGAAVTALMPTGDRGRWVVGDGAGGLRIVDTNPAAAPAALVAGGRAAWITTSADGLVIAAGIERNGGAEILAWSRDGERVVARATDLVGAGGALSPDGTRLVTWAPQRGLRVEPLDAVGSALVLADLGEPVAATWSADGSSLLGLDAAGVLRIVDAATGGLTASHDCDQGAWAPGPPLEDATVRAALLEAGCGLVGCGAGAPGRGVAVLEGDGVGMLAEIDGGVRTCDLASHAGLATSPLVATCLAWLPDGTRLLAGDADGALHVLDARTLATLLTLPIQRGALHALSVSPDGTLIVVAGDGGVSFLRAPREPAAPHD
jgi:hypothetical protein